MVSDLERGRPIWFGGSGRSEADIDLFFADLGPKRSARIELAVMDMWRPFRSSVGKHAPNASVVFDKFHIMRHLSDALDQVRRDEYRRLQGQDRSYIKGQRYTLLSNRENLDRHQSVKLDELLEANQPLLTAYLMRDELKRLWFYRHPSWARKAWDHWMEQAQCSGIAALAHFAAKLKAYLHGILSRCRHRLNTSIVEGINNTIKVIKRRAYGYRDQEYFFLKIRAAFPGIQR